MSKMREREQGKRRVSAEDVMADSTRTKGGGNWFVLPEGVEVWYPKKPCAVSLDVLPFEVLAGSYVSGGKEGVVAPGSIWYKRPFTVFRHIGISDETIISPISIGKKCPIFEERQLLAKNYRDNEKEIKALGMQDYVAYAIVHPEDRSKIAIYAQSYGKFAKVLEKRMNDLRNLKGQETQFAFFSCKDGMTLEVEFTNIGFPGSDGKPAEYLGATSINFVPRKDMDWDEVLAKTAFMNNIFDQVLPYDRLKSMFLQVDEPSENGQNEPPQEMARTSPNRNTAATTTPEAASRQTIASGASGGKSGETSTEPKRGPGRPPKAAAAPASPFEVGDRVKGIDAEGNEVEGEVTQLLDPDNVTVEDDGGEDHTCMAADLQVAEADTDSKEHAADAVQTDPNPHGFKLSDIVIYKGKQATVLKLDLEGGEAEVKVAGAQGKTLCDISDLSPVQATGQQPIKAKAPAKDWKPQEGEAITWDDGGESGTFMRFNTKGDKARVKDSEGEESWQMAVDLKPA